MADDFQRASGETYDGAGGLRSALERTTFISELLRGQPPKLLTQASLPTAGETNRYAIILIPGGAGVRDKVYVGIKNASDAYEWKQIGAIDPSASTTDLKDAMVAAGIIADGGVTNLNLDGGDITCDDIDAGQVTSSQGVRITAGGLLHEAGFLAFWNGTGHSSKPTLTGTYTGTLAQLQTAFHNLTQLLAQYGVFTDSSS